MSAATPLRLPRYRQTRGGSACEQPVNGSQVVLGGAADVGSSLPPLA
ncbi:MAG TPA: hypothetical protein VEQ60_28090 [Longimicrobium sp.]|nr:hypothetical protein [Longimicrobium sp.]